MEKLSCIPLLLILTLLFTLMPVHAIVTMDTTLYEPQQQMSSDEIFLLRKTYPYGYRALVAQEDVSFEQTIFDLAEQQSYPSSSDTSSMLMSESLNSSWPMKSYNAQRIGRTTYSTADNPGLEKWRFLTYVSGVDSGAVVSDDNTIIFGCLFPKLLSPEKGDRRFSSNEETESKEGTVDHQRSR
jgi:hypothetical protein